jgi:Zn-dependent protease
VNDTAQTMQALTVWILPLLLAVTLHEAAHAYAALRCGDRTASMLGRVTLNPLKHIDPFGTLMLPALLFLSSGGSFAFGYAKPVPVNYGALRHPRRDMILVALAGPGMNILLCCLAMLLWRMVPGLPELAQRWAASNLIVAVYLNLVLAVLNMLPILPLDGGRVLVGILPKSLARRAARIEPQGMLIVLFLLFVLPIVGRVLHMNLDLMRPIISYPVAWLHQGLAGLFGFPM